VAARRETGMVKFSIMCLMRIVKQHVIGG